MNFDTRDKIGRWIMGISTGAFILSVVLIVGLLFSDKTGHPFDFPLWFADEPEITVTGEYDDITFLEMEKLLLSTEGMTGIQVESLTRRWEGRRLTWDGFIRDVSWSVSLYTVSLQPRAEVAESLVADIWAQAQFDRGYRGTLLLLKIGQALRVNCEFDSIFIRAAILQDCHLVEVEGPIGPPTPSCDDDGLNCHSQATPNLEGTVS